jgi:hypothetical protein
MTKQSTEKRIRSKALPPRSFSAGSIFTVPFVGMRFSASSSSDPGNVNRAVYNSRIAGMPNSLSSRLIHFLLFVLLLARAADAGAQNWADAEVQLAGKIASAAGSKPISAEVTNRSSLDAATADEIRRGLLTQLAAQGVRLVGAEQAAAVVRITFSEDLRNYVWVAEIRQGDNQSSVVMVAVARPGVPSSEPAAAAMVLHKTPLWSQQERILDAAVIEGNPARMVVLDPSGVVLYRQQDGRWQVEQSFPVSHSRPWPRDLRGRLVLRKDHLFDAYLPGVVCHSTVSMPLTLSCYEGDDPWPIGADLFNLNAPFTSSRNFFGGALSPGLGKQTTAPAFYSAAGIFRDQRTWWLLAAVDGQVHLLDGLTDQAVKTVGRGSDLASLRSGCGAGWQVLTTADGEGRSDTVGAFEVSNRELSPVSEPLEIKGSITAMWTETGGAGVTAVAYHPEMGRYEAFRLTVTCGR